MSARTINSDLQPFKQLFSTSCIIQACQARDRIARVLFIGETNLFFIAAQNACVGTDEIFFILAQGFKDGM